MAWIHRVKSVLFRPLLVLLTALHVSGMVVSVAALAMAACGFILAVLYGAPRIFIVGIWLHLFLDGLDGSLARFQKKADLRGAFVDVVCDQVGIIAATLYLLIFRVVDAPWVLIFAVLYTAEVGILYGLGFLHKPPPWGFRPRIVLYLAFTIDHAWGFVTSGIILRVLTILLFGFVVDGLIRLAAVIKDHS